VENLSHVASRFAAGNRFFIGPREYACSEARRQGRTLVVKLQGVDTLEQAEALRGALLEIPTSEAPPPPEGAYYQHQVMGLQVWTADGQLLGRVADILETGSNDVYVVRGPEGEKLVPAIADVVVSVDIGAGRITIQPIPGLFS
jgi:16S rRNA processing protein RimM